MRRRRYDFVMAVFPNARGIAYVVLEGPQSPVDWGMSDPRGDTRKDKAVRYVAALLDRYTPEVLVLRDRADIHAGRGRLYRLIEALEELAETKGVPNVQFSRQQLRQSFEFLGSPARYAIVEAIAKHIPLFEPYVPPVRKIWKTEDRRMGLFDAIALALTFYRSSKENEAGVPTLR
jgi:hypothetical protein